MDVGIDIHRRQMTTKQMRQLAWITSISVNSPKISFLIKKKNQIHKINIVFYYSDSLTFYWPWQTSPG